MPSPPAPTPKAPASALRAFVATRVEDLTPHLAAWDALAVAAGRPFCAPAWMLAWWHGVDRGDDACLRVVLVVDEREELVGVGPFFAQLGPLRLTEYRLLGAGFTHRIGPLAAADRKREVAAAIAQALATATPRAASVVFEGIDAADRWPELVAVTWPGRRRPSLRTDVAMDAPTISLDAGYEAWMGRRERKFRKEARRTARRLEEDGVHGRIATGDAAIEALLRLHYARWDERGGSNVGREALRVIAEAARSLDGDRVAVALLEGPDGPIAAELVVRAGDGTAFWGGGFDPAWSRHAPGTQAMLLALEAAAADGVRTADLGGGAHEYKWRLGDTNRPLAWRTLFPPGPRHALIRLRLAPKHARFAVRGLARRLPAGRQAQLRRVLRRRRA